MALFFSRKCSLGKTTEGELTDPPPPAPPNLSRVNIIRNVQHSNSTKAQVCDFLEKLNKNIHMSILEDNFDKLQVKQLIEAKG